MIFRALLALGFVVAVACSTSTTQLKQVTCNNVMLVTTPGTSCDFITPDNVPCSDGNNYEIDCQDDGTCSCLEQGNFVVDFIAQDDITSGYCATVTISDYAKLSQQCCQTTDDAGMTCWNLVN